MQSPVSGVDWSIIESDMQADQKSRLAWAFRRQNPNLLETSSSDEKKLAQRFWNMQRYQCGPSRHGSCPAAAIRRNTRSVLSRLGW